MVTQNYVVMMTHYVFHEPFKVYKIKFCTKQLSIICKLCSRYNLTGHVIKPGMEMEMERNEIETVRV